MGATHSPRLDYATGMERRHLEYMVAVAEHGSLARAAERLHVTQPALSLAIAQLERELGTEVLNRRSRPVELTSAGEAILGPAHQVLRGFARVGEAVDEVQGVMTGRLDITTLPTLAQWPAAPLIAQFRRTYPGARVEMHGRERTRVTDPAESVRSGHFELGFTERGAATDGLVEIEIESQDYVAVLPPATPLRAGGKISLDELFAIGLIVGPWWETSCPYPVLRDHCGSRADAAIMVRLAHREAYLPLVLEGAGAGVLPRYVAKTIAAAGAVIGELEVTITRTVVLVHRREWLSPAARAFCDLVPEPGTSVT